MTRKQELKEKRNERIFNDYRNLFNNELMRIDEIYIKLSDKYCIDEKTIARIVSKQSKLTRNDKEVENVP